jgi:hypothetical protein
MVAVQLTMVNATAPATSWLPLTIDHGTLTTDHCLDSPRPDNGGVSEVAYCVVRRPTPRPIHVLRCCVLRTNRTLSETRFDRYSSGSQLLKYNCCDQYNDIFVACQ